MARTRPMCVVVVYMAVLACILAIPAAIAVPLSSNETTTVSENRTVVVDNFKAEETLSKLAAGQTVQQKQSSVQSPSNQNSLKQCDDFSMQSNIDFLLNSIDNFWIRQSRNTTQKLLQKTGNKRAARKNRNKHRRRNRTNNGRKNNRTRTVVRDDETFLCQTFIRLFVIRRKLRSMNGTVWCRGSTAAGVIEDFSETSDMISDGRYGITTNIDRVRMLQESCGENPQSEHKNNTSELVDRESDDLTSDTGSPLAVRVCSGALRVLMQRKNRSRRGRKCSDSRNKRYRAMYRNSLKVKRLLSELRRHVDDYSKHIRDRVQTNDTVA